MIRRQPSGMFDHKSLRRTRRGANRLFKGLRPWIEGLEVRVVLSTMTWDISSGGNWNVAANWVNTANPADHHVPTTADDAVINVPGNVTIVYQGSQPTVKTFENHDTIWVNGSNAGGMPFSPSVRE